MAQEENISYAADILHVTQPPLSRRAEEVLTLIDKIEPEVRGPSGPVDGAVSIGSAEAAAVEILPPLLQDFAEKY